MSKDKTGLAPHLAAFEAIKGPEPEKPQECTRIAAHLRKPRNVPQTRK
jgi:hypothetical protein